MPVILLLLLLFAGSAHAMTSAEFDQYWIGGAINGQGRSTTIVHPRLLIDSAELLAARRNAARAGTANAAIKTRMDAFWTSNHFPPYPPVGGDGINGGNLAQSEAFAVIGDVLLDSIKVLSPTYAQECTTAYGILLLGRSDNLSSGYDEFLPGIDNNWNTNCSNPNAPSNAIEGSGPGLYPSTPVVYDLQYSSLSATIKRKSIARFSKAICASHYEDSGGGLWQWTNYKLGPLLAIYGDSANASFNASIKTAALEAINEWETAYACQDSLTDIGYSENYYAARHAARLFAARMMQKCFPGYNSPLLRSDGPIANGGEFYRIMCRPELYTSFGASKVAMARGPDKFDTKAWNPVVTLSLQAAMFNDKDSWILANYFAQNDMSLGPNNVGGITGSWFAALWHDPRKYTTNIDLADITERHAWDPAWGVFGSRSAWSAAGTSNQDVHTLHFPLYVEGAGHHVAGAWSMSIGSDNLWVSRGYYLTDVEDEYQVFLSQWISRNAIGIMQTGETTFDGESTFYVVDQAGSSCSNLATETWPSAGFQIKGDTAEGLEAFDGACNNPSSTTRPQVYIRGHNAQSAMVDGEAYYVASDLSDAYAATKQDFTRRAWYTDGAGTVIILDQVQVGPAVTQVLSGYQTVNAPLNQAGSITTLAGAAAPNQRVDADGMPTDSWGGIYRITGNTLLENPAAAIKSTNGARTGWTFPLEVRNVSTNSNGAIYCVGGPNSAGQHWMQSKYPCVEGLYSTDTAFDAWVWGSEGITSGWNAASGSHDPSSNCSPAKQIGQVSFSCAGGLTRFRATSTALSRKGTSFVAGRNTGADEGHGKDVGDWGTYTAIDNPGDSDLCESFVVCIGTSSTASKPTVKYTHTGEIVAVAVNQGSGYTVHVVPTATFGPHATTITWDNPLTTEGATYKAVGAEPGFVFDLQDQTGTVIDTLTADSQGYLTWIEAHEGVTAFTLGPHDPHILYPPPTPPPSPLPYTLANDLLYHPRERTVLRAGGGTLLALYYGQGAYGVPIYAQLSRDDGQTWRDLEGSIDSATELVIDEEAAGPNYYTPRADYGFSAALDPTSNDLWIITPAMRLNGSHTQIASLVRAKLYAWDGVTWATSSSYTYNGTEVALASVPRECVAIVSQAHQFFGAWTGPSGANWSVQSVRIKSGTATALSAGAARMVAWQFPQLMESPSGTLWLMDSGRDGLFDADSIRVRTATDGGAAQWGVTSHVPLSFSGTLGEWGAIAGPSGPWFIARDQSVAYWRYGYRSGGSWVTGSVPEQITPGTEPALAAGGITRVVLTSRRGTVLERAYWSLSDGWSGWETIATATGLGYHQLTPTMGTTGFLAMAEVGGDLEAYPFSLPPETEPTGACCSGACSILTYAACVDLGGQWQGPGIPCSPDPCEVPPEVGACCYPDGSCVVTTEAGCGGTYAGDRVTCLDAACPSGPPSVAGRRRKLILAAR